MTENAFLPAFVLAAFAFALALERPTLLRQGARVRRDSARDSRVRCQGLVLAARAADGDPAEGAVRAAGRAEAAASCAFVGSELRRYWISGSSAGRRRSASTCCARCAQGMLALERARRRTRPSWARGYSFGDRGTGFCSTSPSSPFRGGDSRLRVPACCSGLRSCAAGPGRGGTRLPRRRPPRPLPGSWSRWRSSPRASRCGSKSATCSSSRRCSSSRSRSGSTVGCRVLRCWRPPRPSFRPRLLFALPLGSLLNVSISRTRSA